MPIFDLRIAVPHRRRLSTCGLDRCLRKLTVPITADVNTHRGLTIQPKARISRAEPPSSHGPRGIGGVIMALCFHVRNPFPRRARSGAFEARQASVGAFRLQSGNQALQCPRCVQPAIWRTSSSERESVAFASHRAHSFASRSSINALSSSPTRCQSSSGARLLAGRCCLDRAVRGARLPSISRYALGDQHCCTRFQRRCASCGQPPERR